MAIIPSLEKNQAAAVVKEIYKEYEEEGKKVPEWIKVMAHRPEILKEFVGMPIQNLEIFLKQSHISFELETLKSLKGCVSKSHKYRLYDFIRSGIPHNQDWMVIKCRKPNREYFTIKFYFDEDQGTITKI